MADQNTPHENSPLPPPSNSSAQQEPSLGLWDVLSTEFYAILIPSLVIPLELFTFPIFMDYQWTWMVPCALLIIFTCWCYGRHLAKYLGKPDLSWPARWIFALFVPVVGLILFNLAMLDIDLSYLVGLTIGTVVMLPAGIVLFGCYIFGRQHEFLMASWSLIACYAGCIGFYLWFLRKKKDLAPMPKIVPLIVGLLLAVSSANYGRILYHNYQRQEHIVELDESNNFGHEEDGQDGQNQDLSKFYPWKKDNVLAKLDQKSTFTLTKPIVWDGAEMLYPLYASLAKAVLPTAKLSSEKKSGLTVSNRYGGLKPLVQEKTADLIFNVYPKEFQRDFAKGFNLELSFTPIALEAFVFIVPQDFPVDGLTSAQVRQIYAGKITNWKKVGGPKLKIKAFQREENSASQLIMQEFMQDLALQKPLEELLFSSMKTGGHWRTAQYRDLPGALGYGLQSYIARTSPQKVKYLAIDGVLPTPENIASRRYPFVREVLAITRTPQSKTIQQLLAWIVGPQGQELVKKTGYVPLNSR